MALNVEDGTGVRGAESYASVAAADAYWTNRPHDARGVTWLAAATANKEGALRESTTYLDSVAGPFYRGNRAGYVQGLEHPRVEAYDDGGYPLPAHPTVLENACIELAARAVAARLSADSTINGAVKSESKKVGPITKSVEYWGSPDNEKKFGVVLKSLNPILQPGHPWSIGGGMWNWT